MFHSYQGLADSHLDENTFSETFNKLIPVLWNCIKDKAVQIALTLSFTRPPVPPSVSEREIERVKAQFFLLVEGIFCFFGFWFFFLSSFNLVFPPVFNFMQAC